MYRVVIFMSPRTAKTPNPTKEANKQASTETNKPDCHSTNNQSSTDRARYFGVVIEPNRCQVKKVWCTFTEYAPETSGLLSLFHYIAPASIEFKAWSRIFVNFRCWSFTALLSVSSQ